LVLYKSSILSALTLSPNGVISILRVIPVCTAESGSCTLHQTVAITEGGRNTYSQCCGSEIFIPDPDFYSSQIPDPGSKTTATKEEG
jgi:hypothetical protein